MTSKMKKRLTGGRMVLLAVLLLGSTASCFDDSYDLDKDIDMTIHVGGEYLSAPFGSTEQITLDQIIEIEEGDDLQLIDGAYHVLTSGSIDDVSTEVRPVNVDATTTEIDPIEVANDQDFSAGSQETTTNRKQSKPIETSAKDIDEAVEEVYQLTTEKTPINITLTKGGNMNLSELKANVTIMFPDIMSVEGADEKNQITFTITENDFADDNNFIYTVYLTGLAWGDGTKDNGYIIGDDRRIDISEDVTVNVEATVKVASINPGDQLTLTPTIDIEDMVVTSVTGIARPELDESSSTVEIANLPDFLENEETELDITNPIITFTAYNPLDIAVEITGTLYGMKNGTVIDGSNVNIGGEATDPIILQPGNNIISLSRLGTNDANVTSDIQVADLNNLIRRVPDQVNVTIQPTVICNDYFTINLGETYTVGCDYDIDVPLAFGSNMKIVYDETIDDINGSDLEDIDFTQAVVTATVANTIPVGMELTDDNVRILDAAGNKIDGITVSVAQGNIQAGDGSETPVSSELEIKLETTETGTLSRLTAIDLKITATTGSTQGIQLYSNQWVQLQNARLRIPKGVIIDLN